MKKILAILFLLALMPWQVGAQSYSYGIDADRDSIAVRTIRARMDSIRQTRPTVALVLSGGGAKGAAHIGVLDFLDQLDMPIDLVVGTSMGGLMGSMYSLGHETEMIDSLIRGMDWSMKLSDKVPLNYLSYSEKMYRRKYLISLPFYYSKEEFDRQRKLDGNFQNMVRQMDDLKFGAEGNEESSLLKDNLLSSLPSGFVYGQNVNNLFSSLTVGYQDDIPFWELPIPFVCVATEMVTAKPKIWYSGKLNLALRSTMSIPGLFTPVKTDGMVLLDGGMRNNYPTDIARNLGADFIIGVDISEGYMGYDDLKNISDIAMQGIDMLGRTSYENNTNKTDVTVRPDITGYNMLSFDPVSIDTLISRGHKAALQVKDDLVAMKELVGPYSRTLQSKPAVDISAQKVMVSGVEINGVGDEDRAYLMDQLKIKAGQMMGSEELEDAVATIFGTKAFDFVTYELLGSEEPFKLRFNCKKGPIHQLGVAGRMDTDEIISVMLNLGFNVHSVRGHALEFTAKIGSNPMAKFQYYYKTTKGPAVNLSLMSRFVERNKFSFGEELMNVSYYNTRFETYLSNIKWAHLDLNFGVRGDNYRLGTLMSQGGMPSSSIGTGNTYLAAFLNGHVDTFDNGYYPTKGFSLGVDYAWTFGGLAGRIEPFHAAKLDFRTVANMGDKFSVIPSINVRFLFGDEIPIEYSNIVGGCMAGRYLDHQVAFIGVTNAAAMEKNLAVLGADLRYKLFKNNYVSALINFGDAADSFKEMVQTKSMFVGAGLQYSYNSIVGPVKANIHWSSLTGGMGFYVGIGFDF